MATISTLEDLHMIAVEAIEDETHALRLLDMLESTTCESVRDEALITAAIDIALTAGIKRMRIARGDAAADRMARACRAVA